ncbi:RHS repeat protein, partial [Myxococcota bacterium]|nr:RHS repeat protein [Myxococcota bacterium]
MREMSDKSHRSDRSYMPGPAPRFSPRSRGWLAWVWLAAATLSCSRPEATVPATNPRPPTDRDVIAERLAEIPSACLAQTPIVPVSCPAPVPDPAGACIVEQRDLAGGRMTDRWVFDQGRLLRVESVVSDVQHSTRTYEYDALGRVLSETACMTSTGGEPAW